MVANQRPLIGVTGADKRFPVSWWFIRWALRRVGADAVYMTPGRRHIPQHLDGVIISGGDDIDPGLYLPDHDETAPLDRSRDEFEIRVLEQVMPTRKPVLGICRGAQLMNVVLGGTLHTDLRPMRQLTSNRRMLLPRKHLHVDSGTLLERILQTEHCRINSLHHQAIRDLGQGLRVSGRDLDAIVQAVENPDHPFRVGVQWHPEYLPQQRPQLRLFRQLVETAKAL